MTSSLPLSPKETLYQKERTESRGKRAIERKHKVTYCKRRTAWKFYERRELGNALLREYMLLGKVVIAASSVQKAYWVRL